MVLFVASSLVVGVLAEGCCFLVSRRWVVSVSVECCGGLSRPCIVGPAVLGGVCLSSFVAGSET